MTVRTTNREFKLTFIKLMFIHVYLFMNDIQYIDYIHQFAILALGVTPHSVVYDTRLVV